MRGLTKWAIIFMAVGTAFFLSGIVFGHSYDTFMTLTITGALVFNVGSALLTISFLLSLSRGLRREQLRSPVA